MTTAGVRPVAIKIDEDVKRVGAILDSLGLRK